jgi:hypothetical protein
MADRDEEEGTQPCLDPTPSPDNSLAQLQSAAVRYRIAVGPIAGRKSLRLHTPGAALPIQEPAKPLTATRDGFSLNAAVACRADERRKLEQLCRYVARPPIALERLNRDGDGLVGHELKHPFRDGTSQFLFEPLDFLARLAALDCRDAGGRATQEQLPTCHDREATSFATTASSHRTPATAASSCQRRRPPPRPTMPSPRHREVGQR